MVSVAMVRIAIVHEEVRTLDTTLTPNPNPNLNLNPNANPNP